MTTEDFVVLPTGAPSGCCVDSSGFERPEESHWPRCKLLLSCGARREPCWLRLPLPSPPSHNPTATEHPPCTSNAPPSSGKTSTPTQAAATSTDSPAAEQQGGSSTPAASKDVSSAAASPSTSAATCTTSSSSSSSSGTSSCAVSSDEGFLDFLSLEKIETAVNDVESLELFLVNVQPKLVRALPLKGLRAALPALFGNECAIADFFQRIFPYICQLALLIESEWPEQKLPVLKSGIDASITWTRKQASILVANAFFSCFTGISSFFSLSVALQNPHTATLMGVLHYFHRICDIPPEGALTIHRQCIPVAQIPHWADLTLTLSEIKMLHKAGIEDQIGAIRADFANRMIGGGVLRGGCAQEEILFGILSPELISTILVCDPMESNEAIIFSGPERFSTYTGYSRAVQWIGDYQDKSPSTTKIVAYDALMHPMAAQYTREMIDRELMKVYVALFDPQSAAHNAPFATGNWGCGEFGGDQELKLIIQWIAASATGRDVLYTYWGDVKFIDTFNEWLTALKELRPQLTIKDLYSACVAVCAPIWEDAKKNTEPADGKYTTVFTMVLDYFRPSRCSIS
ncbi:poly glycohydrolase [Pelomyxa schiedti]|nr:poly glycohydrolase [Pelomyxa schiedti]